MDSRSVAAAAGQQCERAAPASALSLAPPVLELHQPAVQQCLLYDANVRRAAKGSRRMRRSEVLKEYLHALEQHRALSHACTALALPPQAAPAAAPKASGRGHWWSQSRRSETDSPSSASER